MDTNGMDTNALVAVGADAGSERGHAARPDDHSRVGGRKPVIGAISARRGQANDG